MVGLILIGLVAAYLSRSSVSFAVQRASELADTRTHLSNKLFKTESDLATLKREMMAMNALIHQQEKEENAKKNNNNSLEEANQQAMKELNELQSRIKNLNNRGESLKDRVQAMSLLDLQHKYGKLDPPSENENENTNHKRYVELELVFPEDAHHVASEARHANMKGGGGPTKLVIELAPDHVMPHSVFTFLEMTSFGLLDGCSFILNALHVLKAAPLPYDGSLAATKAKAFAEHGLESVAFKEYNEAYPHEQYTVGFAADGSPSFYINTQDNTDIHIGDPCFGKIVSGLDTVQRLEASPTRNGIWFAQKIGIKRARILPSLTPAQNNKPQQPRLRHDSNSADS